MRKHAISHRSSPCNSRQHSREYQNHGESNNKISKDRFEFQVLYGVPMGDRLELLKEKGYKIRIYVPFGEAWFDYSIRRLKENPKIISYILGNIFKK